MQVLLILTLSTIYIMIYMKYGNGTTNRGIWQCSNSLKHILPTHIIFTEHYKPFRMAIMCGLLLLANRGMSQRQCNSKCSANNRYYLTVQEQTSQVPASMYHIHGLHAMP